MSALWFVAGAACGFVAGIVLTILSVGRLTVRFQRLVRRDDDEEE